MQQKNGLAGTPMNAWDISEGRLVDIITYVKSLSLPEDEELDQDATGWRDGYSQIAGVIEAGEDTWKERQGLAVTEGERLYHKYQCYSCHPAYVDTATTNALRGVDAATAYPENHTLPKLRKDSSYEVPSDATASPRQGPSQLLRKRRSGMTMPSDNDPPSLTPNQ